MFARRARHQAKLSFARSGRSRGCGRCGRPGNERGEARRRGSGPGSTWPCSPGAPATRRSCPSPDPEEAEDVVDAEGLAMSEEKPGGEEAGLEVLGHVRQARPPPGEVVLRQIRKKPRMWSMRKAWQ